MSYSPYRRACLLIPFHDAPHLFVVLNDPCKDENCLIVMISSIKENRKHDDTCVLNKGDHEFIVKPSYVVYRLAETALASHISNMVAKRFYTIKQDCSETLYDKIVDGLTASDETRPRIIKYADSVGLFD